MISPVLKPLAFIGRILYAIYGWAAFLVAALTALLCALFVPGLDRRRRCAAAAGRMFFILAGIPARVSGRENLPEGHCIVVANHGSYLDGVIMNAFLPPRRYSSIFAISLSK